MTPTAALLDAIRAIVREELARDNDANAVRRKPPRKPYRNGAKGCDRHQELIAELVKYGASTARARQAIEKAVGARFDAAPRIIPDAYGINATTRVVYLYEVSVNHGLTDKKLEDICAWRDWLSKHGWSLKLMEMYEHGRMTGIDPETGDLDDESRRAVWELLGANRTRGPQP